jgi:hypothetical protein
MARDHGLQRLGHHGAVGKGVGEHACIIEPQDVLRMQSPLVQDGILLRGRHALEDGRDVIGTGEADVEVTRQPVADVRLAHAACTAQQQDLPRTSISHIEPVPHARFANRERRIYVPREGRARPRALGVVYGDIGTNPLFAMREAFEGHDVAIVEANILGLLSLMFWSLILVITLKYVTVVMRADNEGEGGILARAAFLPSRDSTSRSSRWLLLLGVFGAALLCGDGIITPAISVLAAVEGTTIAAPGLQPLVVPAAVTILVILFAVQSKRASSTSVTGSAR